MRHNIQCDAPLKKMTKAEIDKLVSEVETVELTDSEREKAQGSFISLPCGNTHYEMKGDGEQVVLVHGYATPYYIYDRVFDALVRDGYKVLRYDLLGRGLSERIKAEYTPELFARQLSELTDALMPDGQFYLFGTSMGGTVTTAYCRLYPGRVKKLVLLAPAGMDTFKPPFYMKLCKLHGLGDLIFDKVAGKALLTKCASELKYSSSDDEKYFIESFAACSKYKGFKACTLSSLRCTILDTKHAIEGYRSVAQQKIPLLCIWGTDDKTMPYYQHERLLETCPQTVLKTFEGSGHVFVFDEGERTVKEVTEFLRQPVAQA